MFADNDDLREGFYFDLMLRQAGKDGWDEQYHDERLRWLQENFSYIDSVTMIDATGKITVKERYNPRYSDVENAADNEWCLNRNLLEVFPSLSHSDSTLLQALQKGELLYRENQCTINHSGKKSVTDNVTFPIISRGKIIGAVELSRDVTHDEGERTALAARPTPKRRSGTEAKWTLEDIVTQNSKMLEIKRTIAKVADSRSSVLVYGETGTEKEKRDRLGAAQCRKPQGSALCGGELCRPAGEYSGGTAVRIPRRGRLPGRRTKRGCLPRPTAAPSIPMQINSMPLLLQAELLRVLQEKSVTPLGASKPIPLDVRIIASTNRPISEVVASGQMTGGYSVPAQYHQHPDPALAAETGRYPPSGGGICGEIQRRNGQTGSGRGAGGDSLPHEPQLARQCSGSWSTSSNLP